MTIIKDSEIEFAGLILVLRQTKSATGSTPLNDWLLDFTPESAWIPLSKNQGVTKIFIALSQPQIYAQLMQAICLQISKQRIVKWEESFYEVTGVEVNSFALNVLQITIHVSENLPFTLGRAIHALCFHWLGLADPSLAERLHGKEIFPITLAMKPGKSWQQMYLRVSLLQKELLAPLLMGLSQELGKEITITGVPCRLSKSVEILQSNSFEALAQISGQKQIGLEFLSPTSFKQSQVIQPFPLPGLVFNGLWRRWNAFAPAQLQFPQVDWQGMTSAYELKTKALKMKGGAEIGATGWVRYEFPDGEAQIATTLAHFATFAGVGRKTAMGMGQVKVMR